MMPIIALLLLAAGTCLGVAVLVLNRRDSPVAVPLFVLLAAVAEWNACFAFEISASGLGAKVLWAKLQSAGIAATPVAVASLAARYTGRAACRPGPRARPPA